MVSQIEYGDGIPGLPDEIVVNVLEKLTVKEAVKTSLVSRRFLKLCDEYFARLDFEDSLDVAHNENSVHRFMEFVNHALENYSTTTSIASLRIAFDAGIVSDDQNQAAVRNSLAKWMEYSRKKRVRVLEFDLNQTHWRVGSILGSCFRFPMLDASNSRLTSLTLNWVDINDEEVQDLLERYLINLETLVIENSQSLQMVRVNAQKLKQLEISFCGCRICSFQIISAPNLVSLKFGPKDVIANVKFNEVLPKLSSFSLRGLLCLNVVSELQNYAPFIEQLELGMEYICQRQSYSRCSAKIFSEFRSVKKLVLYFQITRKSTSIMDLMFIIEACPNLQDVKFKCGMLREGLDRRGFVVWDRTSYNHQCLKVVEFDGWWGLKPEVEFASYLTENAANLEKVTFDPTNDRLQKKKNEQDMEAAILGAQKVINSKSSFITHKIYF